MFLKPVEGTNMAEWPGEATAPDGKAWVAFVDDLPVLGTEGAARFEVVPRRRLLGTRKPTVVEGRRGVPARLRRGDRLVLVMKDAKGIWRYDPDGNLGPVRRLALRAARAGTLVAALAIAGSLGAEFSMYYLSLYYGHGTWGKEVGDLVRANAYQVYPRKGGEPSPYLRALIDARKAKADLKDASAAWIKEHPLPQQASETAR